MKKIQIVLAFVVIALNLQAQSIERQVIASGGGSYYDGVNNFEMDYTIGELAVTSVSNIGNTLTQGFEQPFKLNWVSVQEYSEEASQVTVFPNPVTDQLNISIGKPKSGTYRVIVYDMLGQLMSDKSFVAGSGSTGKINLDCNNYTPGNYFVRIMYQNKVVQTIKIVKINQ
jgi:hypothetical protein